MVPKSSEDYDQEKFEGVEKPEETNTKKFFRIGNEFDRNPELWYRCVSCSMDPRSR